MFIKVKDKWKDDVFINSKFIFHVKPINDEFEVMVNGGSGYETFKITKEDFEKLVNE